MNNKVGTKDGMNDDICIFAPIKNKLQYYWTIIV
jgi:hypothetical protein